MIGTLHRSLVLLAFGAALVGAAMAREGGMVAVTQSIIWLPSGVAMAGLWLLGLRAVWVVAIATWLHRVIVGYDFLAIPPAVCGSVAEAVIGVLILRGLGVRAHMTRLRDVMALFAAAAIAPLASIFFVVLGRQVFNTWIGTPTYSGWDGWWRMNALGVLTIVPVAMTWFARPASPPRARFALELAALVVITLGIVWTVMTTLPAGPTAIMVLYVALPVALIAALRCGQRGAVATATIGALFVTSLAISGIGPFACVPIEERHVPLQIFELTLLGVPLVFGSLIAELRSSVSQQLQSEGLRQALLSVLPDVTYRLRVDGTILDVLEPTGVDRPTGSSNVIGRNIAEFAAESHAPRLLAAIELAHSGARPEPVECTLDTPDGSGLRESRYVRLPDGEVLGVVRDITDRDRAQRMLTWQAEILELIATGSPNPAVFAAIVRGLEAFLTTGIGSLLLLEGRHLHVACAPGVPGPFSAAIEGLEIGPDQGSCGTAAHDNRTVVAADIATDPLWTKFRDLALAHDLRACWSVPVRSPGGQVLGTFAIYHRTVRAPTAGEIALVERAAVLAGIAIDRERRESLLASIHRNVSQGLFRSVQGQGLVYVNEAFAQLFGYRSPDDLLAATAKAVGSSGHAGDLARFASHSEAQGTVELLLHRRDGGTFWGLLSHTAVPGAAGAATVHDGALADITAQKDLAEQLRQAQKMEAIGKLAGGVAHDFNNLLTAISGYAEAVRATLPIDEEPRRDVDEILRAAHRAAELTCQLLAFSRQQMLSPQVLDLAAVVDNLGNMLRRLIGEHIQLATHYSPGPSCVLVDRSQLEQVLLNLVVNARDAMPAGGTLTITTAPVLVDEEFARSHVELLPGPYVALTVRDDGVGMTDEVQTRAFDPFFTTKALGQGTGLGLSTVYGIVKQSGGTVWIDSAPGAGTTISIYLPRVAGTPAIETTVAIPRPAVLGATVLIAEDEELVRDLLQRILRREGYKVLLAKDGPTALALAERHAGVIDLLLTDAVMPHMSGRELAKRMLVVRPGLPVLFMSGYAGDNQPLAEPAASAVAFLQKPFVAARLLEQASMLLEPTRARVLGADVRTTSS